MSHIPSSAMPHAGPIHHEPAADASTPTTPPAADAITRRVGGWPLAAIALGGVLALGAVAVALPMLRKPAKPARKAPKPKPKSSSKRKAQG